MFWGYVRPLQVDKTLGFQLMKSSKLKVPNCKTMRSHVSPTVVLYHPVHAIVESYAVGVGFVVTIGIGSDEELKFATQ